MGYWSCLHGVELHELCYESLQSDSAKGKAMFIYLMWCMAEHISQNNIDIFVSIIPLIVPMLQYCEAWVVMHGVHGVNINISVL